MISSRSSSSVVSIITHYNSSRYLKEALCSVLNQNLEDHRIILIDDSSHDESWLDIISPYRKDPRLSVFVTSENVGNYRIKARLIPAIESVYVSFQDADDVSDEGRLSAQIDYLEAGGYDIVGCSAKLIDDQSNVISEKHFPEDPLPFWRKGKSHFILGATAVVRRTVFRKIGSFDGTARVGADTDFFHRAIRRFKVRNLPKTLYSYRIHENSLTNDLITGFGSDIRKAYQADMLRRLGNLPQNPTFAQLRPREIDLDFTLTSK